MQKLMLKIQPNSGATVVSFEGDFDGYIKEDLEEVQKLVDTAPANSIMIFDFSKLNYLNSYAIGHLVDWYNHLHKTGGMIHIAGANKNVADIFSILGIASLFKLYPDAKTALSEVK